MAIELTPSFPGLGQSFVPEIQRGQKGEKGDKGDKGDTGNSGVYVGTTEPTDPEVKIWLNPEGEAQPGRFVRYDDAQSLSNEQKSIARANIGVTSGSSSSGGSARPTIYCWGDSLTEGVGGYVMQVDNQHAYMAYSYPDWLGQTWNVVNLGARSENIPAIMARQGADPIVLQSALNIPASKDTPVLIQQVTQLYNQTTGLGFTSKSGALVKICKEVESPGLNPCVIAGVEGIIYRETVNTYLDNETTYNYYFKRLESGTAVTAPSGTEIETYAMRYYRNGGVAVIWMGANGGYSSVADFINKVNAMVEYGEYSNYLVIISREFSGADLQALKSGLTDDDGFCHVISLMDQLPYRGYAMAGIPNGTVDTSWWTTTDVLKKAAPLLCEFIASGTGEDQYGTLHYSSWGYKAIGKLVNEKLGTMDLYTSGGGSGPETDDYGTLMYKLKSARSLDGTTYINTKVKLFDAVSKSWTFAIKWSGSPTTLNGWPANVFCCAKDGTWKGLLYRYYTTGAGNFLFGNRNSNMTSTKTDGMVDNYGGTNIVIVSRDGDNYTAYCNGKEKAYGEVITYTMAAADTIDLPLILGARYNAEGTEVHYQTIVTIEDCRVYDDALDETAMSALYDELAASGT